MASDHIKTITNETLKYTVHKKDTLSEIAVQCRSAIDNYKQYSSNTAAMNRIQELNPDIEDVDLIYVGQVITLQLDTGESTPKKSTTKSQQAKITAFGLQSNTDRTVFATWAWSKSKTDHYKVKWLYATGDGVGFIGTEKTVTSRQDVYNAPENATHVAFEVKPISTTYKSGNKDVHHWTASWSTRKKYYFSDNPPKTPADPQQSDVTFKEYKMTITLKNIPEDLNATGIQIQVWENGKVFRTSSSIKISAQRQVSYSCTCQPGKSYTVRYRSTKGSLYSDWTKFSEDEYTTVPAGISGIESINMISSTSVNLSWYADTSAESYEVQYTAQRELFDAGTNEGITTVPIEGDKSNIAPTNAIITGLTAGTEYFFRVRSVNKSGKALVWSEVASIGVGMKPGAPTTWSSRTTVAVGDPLILYWMHNTEGGSRQTEANLQLTVGNEVLDPIHLTFGISYSKNDENNPTKIVDISDLYSIEDNTTIKVLMMYTNTLQDISLNVNELGEIPVEVSGDNTTYWDANSIVTFTYDSQNGVWKLINCSQNGSASSYEIDTSAYPDGTTIKWSVQTAGIVKDEYGYVYSEYSTERTIDIYAQPTVTLVLTDSSGNSLHKVIIDSNGDTEEIPNQLTSLPFNISALALPATQKPVSYVVSVIANEPYEIADSIGNIQRIKAGEEIYYKYVDTSANPLSVDISANDINLRNNISYTVKCTVSMNSGLIGETSSDPFTVSWNEEDELWPDAEIAYDTSTFTTLVKPFCIDTLTDELIEDVTLSLYRREFDGSFTEIATGLDNVEGTYVTDPHPSLDYARYRVVAVKNSTGAVSYYDVPGFPINEKAVIIQWDEEWSNFDALPVDDAENSYSLESPPWTGSLLRIPYNIDISDQFVGDADLVRYIGRRHPVSYYGTQQEHTSSWSFVIPKTDSETIYGLRRLSSWMGDVYIREPSGSGYWANVRVSMDIQHKEVTIPVMLEVTRVEGGK